MPREKELQQPFGIRSTVRAALRKLSAV
ncbi:MAG: GntR family transcriptional regulator [Ruminococcus sp.]|nr:GntR family transcriptional regulator [Ruminococcus sp.]